MDHLVNKPYVNGVSLGEQKLNSKYYQNPKQRVCKRWVFDLFKELLCISVGQRIAKLQTVKVRAFLRSTVDVCRVKCR